MADRKSGQPVIAFRQHTSHASPACALLFFYTGFNLTNIKVLQSFNAHYPNKRRIILQNFAFAGYVTRKTLAAGVAAGGGVSG
jgi:hypothetical protein